jgi:hypothetical protein
MIYKQNTGVLSKNQSILKRANVIFSINRSKIDNDITYSISRCNGYYLLGINIKDIDTLKITPSTSCYDVEVNVNQEDVYKENGGVVVNLNQILSNELCIKIKINQNESLLISYKGNRTGKKVITLK